MEKYDFDKEFKTLRERNDITASASYSTKHSERITIELLDLNRKTLEKQYNSTESLITMLKEFDSSNTKLSKKMFWLTIATALLAIAQVVVAIIALR